MMILDVVSTCSNYALANLFMIVQKAFTILQILVPIIAIVFLALNLVKSTINPDNKKNFSQYKNWLIGLVMVFFLPVIVNTVMGILGEDYSVSACWNNAEAIYNTGESTYNDGNEGDKSTIITDPNEYSIKE